MDVDEKVGILKDIAKFSFYTCEGFNNTCTVHKTNHAKAETVFCLIVCDKRAPSEKNFHFLVYSRQVFNKFLLPIAEWSILSTTYLEKVY